MGRKLPEALKAHQFKKGEKPKTKKAKRSKKPLAGGVRSAMPGLVDASAARHVVRV